MQEAYRYWNILSLSIFEKIREFARVVYFLGGYSKITDLGFKNVIDCMSHLGHLQKIGIDVGGCEKITNKTLHLISQFLKDKPHLKRITIGYNPDELPGITKDDDENFFRELDNLEAKNPNLKIKWREI